MTAMQAVRAVWAGLSCCVQAVGWQRGAEVRRVAAEAGRSAATRSMEIKVPSITT
jgi:hypothetical protein